VAEARGDNFSRTGVMHEGHVRRVSSLVSRWIFNWEAIREKRLKHKKILHLGSARLLGVKMVPDAVVDGGVQAAGGDLKWARIHGGLLSEHRAGADSLRCATIFQKRRWNGKNC